MYFNGKEKKETKVPQSRDVMPKSESPVSFQKRENASVAARKTADRFEEVVAVDEFQERLGDVRREVGHQQLQDAVLLVAILAYLPQRDRVSIRIVFSPRGRAQSSLSRTRVSGPTREDESGVFSQKRSHARRFIEWRRLVSSPRFEETYSLLESHNGPYHPDRL